MKQVLLTIVAFFIILVCLGSNYHASGVTSGVYLRPLDVSDGIYAGIYPPQLSFLKKWQNCERTLIFQNLEICKMKLEARREALVQLVEGYNKMRAEMNTVLERLEIDPNDVEEINRVKEMR